MNKIPRTLHEPALQRSENNERVATYNQNFEDAPRASVTTRGNKREGRHLLPEFPGRSTRQRHDAPKTTRRSTLTPRISKTLHAPASRRAELTPRISRTLHTPASRRAENSKRVTTCSQNFEDAPRASVTTHGKQRERPHLRPENFEDAPHASVTTRREQQEGRHLRPEFPRRSTRQRHDARKTTRRSPLTPRISRTLHTPASRRAGSSERVATYAQNFEDAPHSSIKMRRNHERVSTCAQNFEDAPGASMTPGCDHRRLFT